MKVFRSNPLSIGAIYFLVMYLIVLLIVGSPAEFLRSDGTNYQLVSLKPLNPIDSEIPLHKSVFYSRIFMPFTVWLFSFGNDFLSKSITPILNIIAAIVSAYFLGKIFDIHEIKNRNLTLMLYIFNPILILTAFQGFTESFMLVFVFSSYYYAQCDNYKLSVPLMAAAILTREIAFFALIGLIFQKPSRIKYYILSLIPYLLWIWFLSTQIPLGDFFGFYSKETTGSGTIDGFITRVIQIYTPNSMTKILSCIYFLFIITTTIFLYIKRENRLLLFLLPAISFLIFKIGPAFHFFGLGRYTSFLFPIYIFLGFIIQKISRLTNFRILYIFPLIYILEILYSIYFLYSLYVIS